MPVISIATQKGGTGKTTTAINLSAALQRAGYSVLMIDADPQCNLTYSLGFNDDQELNLYTEYKKEISGQKSDLRSTICHSRNGMALIPSSIELANAELELVSKFAREYTFRNRMLKPLVEDYEFIIIDCPPSFGMLTVNALVASDYILIPLQGEFLPRKGVESFLRLLANMKEVLDLKAKVLGFLLTRFSPRKTINRKTKDWLQNSMPYPLFKTYIHADIKLAMAQKKGEDIFNFSADSQGAQDYEDLAKEILAILQPTATTSDYHSMMETV